MASPPRYQKIALDVAQKIVEGLYKEGDRIYARSTLASRYGVSPETARRAIGVLSDLDIVETKPGAGVLILSRINAEKFVKQMNEITTIGELQDNMVGCMARQQAEIVEFKSQLKELMSRIEHYRYINPFSPYKLDITDKTPYLHLTISEIAFWQNTTATLIAIKRNGETILSPGPYMALNTDDIIYFVGGAGTLDRVRNFLYPESQ
ncbi:MAG TPA: TrkA C-terminal domain-containing protein [Treponemataceae bacterium]|nr:TrkA C-terminal domain-containing protein [Treponemataceae bacterium]